MEREDLHCVTPLAVDGRREGLVITSDANREGETTDTRGRDGAARSSVEGPVMGLEPRGCVVQPWLWANW